MNLILQNSARVQYYTYLDTIFDAVAEFESYWYLISELEYNQCEDPRLLSELIIISGAELKTIVEKEHIQFIWGVLSAFTEKPTEVPDELPFADGNPEFWKGSPQPQAPGAKFEIVCFDSSLTLFIGVPEPMAEKLRRLYPDILDLDAENLKRANNSPKSDAAKPRNLG